MVVSADAMRAEGFPRQVEQFAPDLHGRQVEEVSNVSDLCLGQGSVKANQAPLENVIGLHPAAEARMAVKHLSGEPEEPITRMVEQSLFGHWVSVEGLIQKHLDLGV